MTREDQGNFVSEWFGHRIYPRVVRSSSGLSDMRAHRCPFLSRVKEEDTPCVKNARSMGVCTISCCSNGARQDWVACPYRVFDPALIDRVAANLYGPGVRAMAGPRLASPSKQRAALKALKDGKRVLVYFDAKIGGEVSVSGTDRSPEMAFDVTLVELLREEEDLKLGQFAIMEVQTMDFHGSYGKAVGNLQSALTLHRDSFAKQLQANQRWAGDGIEGPNIANVFKRTFYQMMFKFHFGTHQACAGTALVISASVWDSWQPFLAGPKLRKADDGTLRLLAPGARDTGKPKAWIHVFDTDPLAAVTPSPVVFDKVIGLSADVLGHYALQVAPQEASRQLLSEAGIYSTLRRRIHSYWPTQIIKVDVSDT